MATFYVCCECSEESYEGGTCVACSRDMCQNCMDEEPYVNMIKGKRFIKSDSAPICTDCFNEYNETPEQRRVRYCDNNARSFLKFVEQLYPEIDMNYARERFTESKNFTMPDKFKDIELIRK